MAGFGLGNLDFGTGSNPDWFGQFGGQVATTGQGINESPYAAGGGTPPTSQQAADYAAQTASQGFPAGSQPGVQTAQGGPQNGDFQSWFMQLTNGKPPTPDTLKALGPQLAQYGISLVPNAAGIPGKIKLPDGSVVDVIQGAGLGGQAWQWLGPGSGGGAGAQGGAGGFGSLNFNSPYQTFNGLSLDQFKGSPGYEFALQQGLRGVDSRAAAMGTLGTGGTRKAEIGYAEGLASQDYSNAWNRAFQGNQANFGNALQTNQTNYGNLYNLASLGQKSAAG